MSNNNHRSLDEPRASNVNSMSSLTPDQPQIPYNAALALGLASNKNLLMVLQTGTAAQARRRQRSASTTPQDLVTPSSTGSKRSLTSQPPTQAVSDGYQSSDDSLHLPPSARQRHARANAPFLPPLPGHSAMHAAVDVASAGVPHEVVAAPAAASSGTQQIRRNLSSSVSSAFSWQESIFDVRRLSDDACNAQAYTPVKAPRLEHGCRSLVPPPRHGSRPHPNPLRSNPVFEGGWI